MSARSPAVTGLLPPGSVAEGRRRQGPWRQLWRDHVRLLLGTASGLAFLALWELYARSGAVNPLFLPAPSQVGPVGWQLISTGDWLPDLQTSATEFGVGFVLAVLLAIPLGLAAGWYRPLRDALNPFLATIFALPHVALVPWIIILFGIDFLPKVVMVFIGVFFPVVINTRDGVRTVNPDYLRVARSFGAGQLWTFTTIVLPACIPFILAGVRVAIGTGLIGLIIAEFVTANSGVGYRIHVAGHQLQTPTVFVGIMVIAAIAMVLTTAANLVERRFQGWQLRG